MSFHSASKQLEKIGNPSGYCFPLALDSIMPNAELPERYYDMFKEAHAKRVRFNEVVGRLMREYFEIEPHVDEASKYAVAEFDAYGGSPQPYFPDAPYDYTEELKKYWNGTGVTAKQLRMRELIVQAANAGCGTLFYCEGKTRDHIAGLQLVDHSFGGYSARFLIRNRSQVVGDRVYNPNNLTGITRVLEATPTDEFCPLPEYTEDWYPEGQTSATLVILPPEPRS